MTKLSATSPLNLDEVVDDTDKSVHRWPMADVEESCRADVWLWRARFAKTRSLAVELIERGMVRLTHNGQAARLEKPGRPIRPGDILTIALQQRVVVVRVESIGNRRGPAEEARRLYTAVD